MYILETKYVNQDMNIELTSYIDNKQKVWFQGRDIAKIHLVIVLLIRL